jgi:hypothetical protein
MSVGSDIKEVVVEIGSSFNRVIFDGISGESLSSAEYLDFEPNSQVTKPFIREFFLEATFPYDSESKAGDVIAIPETSHKFMIMNKTPVLFEDSPVEQSVVLYKCNVSGELSRPSGETSLDNYRTQDIWSPVKKNAYGLLTEIAFGTDVQESEVGEISRANMTLFLPASFGAKSGDRYVVHSGETGSEYYKIGAILKRRFDHIDECEVSEDTEEFS